MEEQNASELNENEHETLKFLSDVDKNTEIYKLFEEDILFLDYFFSFEEHEQIINDKDSIQKFIISPIFEKFQHQFETFLLNKQINSFQWILELLSFLLKIRPKLQPIIVFIFPIVLKVYSSSLIDLESFLKAHTKFSYFSFPSFFNLFIHQLFFENINIKQYILESSASNSIETINQEIIKNQICDIFLFTKENKKVEEELLKIIYFDEIDDLISFLLMNPALNINSNISCFNCFKLRTRILNESLSLIDLCCYFGSIKCFKYLVCNDCAFTSDTQNYSIIGGNFEIVQILNQRNLNFDDCFETSIKYHHYSLSDWLFTNFKCKQVLEGTCLTFYNFKAFLFIHYNRCFHYTFSQTDYDNDEKYFPPYLYFYWNGYLNVAKYILSMFEFNHFVKENLERALIFSSEAGHLHVVEYLIQIGCNKEFVDYIGFSPLLVASREGHLSIVKYLIQIGCNINCQNTLQDTALHLACKEGHLQIVECLIANGCNKEIQNSIGDTPLHVACHYNYLSIVKFLVTNGCDTELENYQGLKPIQYAIEFQYYDIIDYLNSCK